MDNKQIAEKLEDLSIFYEVIGFDNKTIADHQERLWKLVFASVIKNLEKVIALKDKASLPEIKSIKDFFDYYEKYINRTIIEKIIQEETHKVFSGYFKTIGEQLPK